MSYVTNMNSSPGWQIDVLETSSFTLDGGAMFGVVPRELWKHELAPDDRNGVRMSMRAVLLRGFDGREDRRILVDCGMGDGYDARWLDRFAVEPASSGLFRGLHALGCPPESITDLICTHLHFDHCGGLVRPQASRAHDALVADVAQPSDLAIALDVSFPSARHHVQRTQLEHALAPNAKDRASFLRERFQPVLDGSLFVTHEGEAEIAPGIFLRPVNGHSPGMQIVEIVNGFTRASGGNGSEDGARWLHLADLVPTSAHLRIPWVMAYDNEPLQTLSEKIEIVVPFIEAGGIVLLEHDPHIAAARVTWSRGRPDTITEVALT